MVSPYQCGLNQGPIVIMVRNYRSGLIWRLLRENSHIVAGLRAAGFAGGWPCVTRAKNRVEETGDENAVSKVNHRR